MVFRIARALGVSVEYLVTGRDIVLELAKSLKAWRGKDSGIR
jgi:hypothetical protein